MTSLPSYEAASLFGQTMKTEGQHFRPFVWRPLREHNNYALLKRPLYHGTQPRVDRSDDYNRRPDVSSHLHLEG